MAKIKLDVVTAEHPVFSDEADFVIAPGSMGELGILPKHAPLLTTLEVGEIRVRKDGEEYSIFTSGVVLWLVYGVLLGAWPIIIANVITLTLVLSILAMVVRYRRATR